MRSAADRILEMLNEHSGCEPNRQRIPGLLELIAFVRPRSVLEIGSYDGVSAEIFALHCESVICMDNWGEMSEDIRAAFFNRMRPYANTRVIVGRSPEALVYTAGELFDLVYIDGDHREAGVTADIVGCRHHLPGVRLSGHDYDSPDCPGVKKAVDKLIGSDKIKLFSDRSWVQV